MLRLYSYWRSSSAYRVRIALRLKQLTFETVAVNLAAGEQNEPAYRAINTDGLVPLLEHGERRVSQSLNICAYLDEEFPAYPLVPADPELARAQNSFVLAIACEIQPLNNLRVLNYLGDDLELKSEQVSRWYRHWIQCGFRSLETQLAAHPRSEFAFAETPGLAECLLVPQMYNARRFDCPLDDFPRLRELESRCAQLPAFASAHPDAQPDKPETR